MIDEKEIGKVTIDQGGVYNVLVSEVRSISSMALKPVDIRWFRTGSQPDWKNMYSIELQTISRNIKIKIIQLIPVLSAPRSRRPGLNRIIFHFDIPGKLFIIRCDRYIFLFKGWNNILHQLYVFSHLQQFKKSW